MVVLYIVENALQEQSNDQQIITSRIGEYYFAQSLNLIIISIIPTFSV
jgi:hypothetical protein